MRVLYVEDEKFLADAVKHNLEKNDIDVDHAADGEDNYIEVYMSRLRKTMKKNGAKVQIKTSRGLGYKLIEA